MLGLLDFAACGQGFLEMPFPAGGVVAAAMAFYGRPSKNRLDAVAHAVGGDCLGVPDRLNASQHKLSIDCRNRQLPDVRVGVLL